MRKQEIKDLEKYVFDKKVIVFSNECALLLKKILRNIQCSERPDFYSKCGNTVYIIEHFISAHP